MKIYLFKKLYIEIVKNKKRFNWNIANLRKINSQYFYLKFKEL